MNRLVRGAAIALVVAGLVIAGYGLYSMTIGDQVLAGEQQDRASRYASVPDGLSYRDWLIEPTKVRNIGDIFAKLYVPRFGDRYVRLVAQGTVWDPVLNKIGVGHYVSSAMPGQVGNFAVAAHRGGFGGSFHDIHKLGVGDIVYLETRQGWFAYEYLQSKIVLPNDISVISSVPPELKAAHPGGKYMTMTSCTPIWVNTHRIVVWLQLIGARSRSQGPFPELAWATAHN